MSDLTRLTVKRGLSYVLLHRQVLAVALGMPSSENKFQGGRNGKGEQFGVRKLENSEREGDWETAEEASLVQNVTSSAPQTRSLHSDSAHRSVGGAGRCSGLKRHASAPLAQPAADTRQGSSIMATSHPLSLSRRKSCFPGTDFCYFPWHLSSQSVHLPSA